MRVNIWKPLIAVNWRSICDKSGLYKSVSGKQNRSRHQTLASFIIRTGELELLIASKLSSINLAAHFDKKDSRRQVKSKVAILCSGCALVVLVVLVEVLVQWIVVQKCILIRFGQIIFVYLWFFSIDCCCTKQCNNLHSGWHQYLAYLGVLTRFTHFTCNFYIADNIHACCFKVEFQLLFIVQA